MAYTALYRAFRPKTFSEMVGQEHITTTLKNQIISGRVGHAYLFSGGRGTGKTSSAKILARAINCLNPQNGEPCNECEICKQILAGSLTDVVEMDAASNNSVEDIRAIREEVNFLPTLAKYRVYIIDEVHMLSTGAFNALLKTLEEPPEHVKFILATTEPQKLPATILSRCQRFDFKRLGVSDIVKRLEIICKESNIEITVEALKIIANLSEGAMRDAISILERCIQDGENKISEEKIKELVGIPKLTYIYEISKAILEYNVDSALNVTENVLNEGKDLNVFLWEIVKYIKDILLLKVGSNLVLYSEEERKDITGLANLSSKERLLKIINSLSEIDNKMKCSSQKTIVFQVGIMSVCNKEENEGIEELENRISNLENIIKSGVQVNNVKHIEKKIETSTSKEQIAPKIVQNVIKSESSSSAKTANNGEYVSYWNDVITDLHESGKVMLYTNLINTRAKQINDLVLEVEFPNGLTSFGKLLIDRPENKQVLTKMVSVKAGKEMQLRFQEVDKPKQQEQQNPLENLSQEIEMPINYIEEE